MEAKALGSPVKLTFVVMFKWKLFIYKILIIFINYHVIWTFSCCYYLLFFLIYIIRKCFQIIKKKWFCNISKASAIVALINLQKKIKLWKSKTEQENVK